MPSSRTVVVCAYTLERLALTERCLAATLAQDPPPEQVVAVIDHNPELLDRLAASFPTVEVIPNAGPRGLSGARNTGIDRATGDLVAFVDDDAVPSDGWLAGLSAAFIDPAVIVAGGRAIPSWEGDRPGWFPEEFLWTVGCSYLGQPASGDVRNPLGCNMAFRRTVFEAAGSFDPAVGRLGTLPIGAEETELCIRARRAIPGGRIVLVDGAEVHHTVPRSRARLGYVIRRCFYEGVSKAVVRRLSKNDALGTERSYVARTVTGGILRHLGRAVRLQSPIDAIGSAVVLGVGVVVAAGGYAYGSVRARASRPEAAGVAVPGSTHSETT